MVKKKLAHKPRHQAHKGHRIWRIIASCVGGLTFVLLIFLLWCQFKPLNTSALASPANPYTEYGSADRAAVAMMQADKANTNLNPDCNYRYLKQPSKVERVIVIRHGLTNCPRQFDELAERYHSMGYAVLITRIPEHGMRDRMAPSFSNLRAEDTLADLNRSIDIAQGLGEYVDIMGLSAGANEVAYIATERNDIHQVIMIDPIFTPTSVPSPLNKMVAGALLTLPNQFIWWSDKQKSLDGPTSAYYGWQTRPVGEYLRITEALREKNRHPLSTHAVLITNENDAAVNNEMADLLAQSWRDQDVDVTAYRFPKSAGLGHDLIDPLQVGANTATSYPQIITLTTMNYADHHGHNH